MLECVAVSQLCPDLESWGGVRKKRAVGGYENPLLLRREGHVWIPGNSVLPSLTGALSGVTPTVSFPSELEKMVGFQPHSRAPCGGGHAVPVLRVYDAL